MQNLFFLTATFGAITLAVLTINVCIDNYVSAPRKVTYTPVNNTEYGARPLFPLIIHQTYKSYKVPKEFTDWVRSWHRYNPEWEYWFWSRAEIDALVNAKYPHFKDMFDHYDQGIRRADAVR
jgi:mannosyltransferase OCH1-like enzyme